MRDVNRLARQLLLVFLIAWLPVQFAWAAVSGYCAHESAGAAAAHFGHHDHQHVGIDTHSDEAEAADPKGSHPDCATCHFGVAAPQLDFVAAPMAPPFFAPGGTHGALGSAPSARPERPNWRPA